MLSWLKKKANVNPVRALRAEPLLHSVPLLYALVVAALVNQVSYALLGDLTTPALFILLALITSSFSKNMIVILTFALVFSNVVKFGTRIQHDRINEGMTKLTPEEAEAETEAEDKKAKKVKKVADPEPDVAPSMLDPTMVKEAKTKLAELKGIQESLLSAMGNIDTHLKNADKAMDSLNEGFKEGAKKNKK